MKLEYFLTPCTKINWEWIKDLNVRPETIKFLEENIGRILNDVNQSKILYDPPPRVTEIKVNKWDLMKLKNFCTAKETISKVKRQPSEWEKIMANETTDRINFQNIQAAHTTQYQKNNQPNQKVGKRPKQTFLQRRHAEDTNTSWSIVLNTHTKPAIGIHISPPFWTSLPILPSWLIQSPWVPWVIQQIPVGYLFYIW